jgi:hypothetical protein
MRVVEYPSLVVNGDMSGNITSIPFLITQGWIGAIQAHWTGAPVGTIELLISNDNVIYSVYTGSSTTVSGSGDFLWNLAACGFNYIKVQYTFTSGTGTLNVTANYKGIV